MFPWVLVVLMSLPNGSKTVQPIMGFLDEPTCEKMKEQVEFTNRDGTKAPAFCVRYRRA